MSDLVSSDDNSGNAERGLNGELHVDGVPFSRYGIYASCDSDGDISLIKLQYFDPEWYPKWDDVPVPPVGGYPHYFELDIDLGRLAVIEARGSRM